MVFGGKELLRDADVPMPAPPDEGEGVDDPPAVPVSVADASPPCRGAEEVVRKLLERCRGLDRPCR